MLSLTIRLNTILFELLVFFSNHLAGRNKGVCGLYGVQAKHTRSFDEVLNAYDL